ncbi:MAG: hypothetical protein ACRDY1_04840 [Acidimicrobiales bacterium]
MTIVSGGTVTFIRPPRNLRVALVVVISLLALGALMIWAVTSSLNDLGGAVGKGMAAAITDSGASDASEAATLAQKDSPSALADVPLAQLQEQAPSQRWLSGTAVSTSDQQVSVILWGDHVTTAVDPLGAAGLCSYGLSVVSAADPILALYGLPGPGAYTNFSGVGPCEAGLAPASGWTSVSTAELRQEDLGVPSGG